MFSWMSLFDSWSPKFRENESTKIICILTLNFIKREENVFRAFDYVLWKINKKIILNFSKINVDYEF